MVMRIDDHLRGVQDFFLPRGEPILSDGEVMLHLMLGHGVFLTVWLYPPWDGALCQASSLGEAGCLFYGLRNI
jgi:hypothetical protein